MQRKQTLCQLAIAMTLLLASSAMAQQPSVTPDRSLDAAMRNKAIDELLKQLNRVYVFPDVAKKMEQTIRARQARKEYDSITSGSEFAKTLTNHLRQVRDDSHLSVDYFPNGIPYDSEKPPVAADVEKFREQGRLSNYQYRKVERLDGRVGLLQVDGFYPEEWAQETIVAAMSFLANSEAIILDLRQNHGGAGATLLCSYFFEDATHLSDFYNRAENTTRQYWTYPIVPGKKLADKDLYILTSHETISAPEALASDMQILKRATIVGEPTHGGANPTTIFRITDHFSASIPFARLIHPGETAPAEASGVKPDVLVPANQALITAHLLALKKALKRHSADQEFIASLKRTISEKEKELETIKTMKPSLPKP
ncbi:MAG: S41 family peptidase [Armatimonas sp.]